MKKYTYLVSVIMILFFTSWAAGVQAEKTAQEYFNAGTSHAQKGMIEEAEKEFKKATKLDPTLSGKAHYMLGMAYAQKNMLKKAIAEYEKAVQLNPKVMIIRINLANVYLALGRFDKTILEYENMAELNPGAAWPRYNLANLYMQQKMYSDAVEEFKKAIAIDPSRLRGVHFQLGFALQNLNMYGDAISEYEKAVAENPKHYKAYYNLGLLCFKNNELDKAISEKRLKVINPMNRARAKTALLSSGSIPHLALKITEKTNV
jgi:tetratricopeptide (TPR) repeat protein